MKQGTRKAIKLDDFDEDLRQSKAKRLSRHHLGYDQKPGLEHTRRLRPVHRANILGIDPYRR